jgi:hypothetical protein
LKTASNVSLVALGQLGHKEEKAELPSLVTMGPKSQKLLLEPTVVVADGRRLASMDARKRDDEWTKLGI